MVPTFKQTFRVTPLQTHLPQKKAKTQFNILGPNLLLNSNRSFLQFYYLQSYTTPVPHPYLGRFPRNFKTLNFKPKLLFLMKNHKNDNKGEFLNFYEFTLYMIFEFFYENSHYRNGHFQENRENHI